MKKLIKPLCFLSCFVLTLALFGGIQRANAAPETGKYDLFVSPAGDDTAAGTFDAPLKTVAAAKEKLKTLKKIIPTGETVHVWLRGGRYEFKETLLFTEDDQANVTFAAYNDEEVVFSGAREIAGFTEETVNGVRVFTKKLDPSKDPVDFKSLFNGDRQLNVPRYPEEGYFIVKDICPEDDLWTEEDTPWDLTRGQRSFYADPADLAADFTNPEDVQVRILHYWHDELMFLTGIDRTTGKLSLSRPSSMYIRDIDRYYFENVFEALNEPGEWYLNNKENKLYYVPQEGETADATILKASSLERLIEIEGVSGVCFERIRFTETDWKVPTPGEWESGWRVENDVDALQAALDVRGVVEVSHAENAAFINCEFTNLGADGVKFLNGVRHSRVESCLFRNIAATAVFVGGTNGEPGDPDVTTDITVTNNDISGYGRKFFCAIGVHITYCDGAEITHNEISDGYYTAISCGWTWGYTHHLTNNIKIRDNLIYNIGQGWLSDMGGIYMLGIQPGTELTGNVIHNVAADPGEGGYGGWGIYLDEGSSRMLVEKNLVFRCGSQSYNIHYGEGNIFRNNIGALSAEGQVSAGSRGEEPHATAFYYDNIFVSENDQPIYIYMLHTGHFYENGNLLWNLSGEKKLRFCTDGGNTGTGLNGAVKDGYLHNPTVADPLFNDITAYDFTLAEDSPAFDLNFKAWDYQNAGTLKDSTVGFSQQGGRTAYNDHVSVPESSETQKSHISLKSVLLPLVVVFSALVGLFWLVKTVLSAERRQTVALALAALMILSGVFIYRNFVLWNPALYMIGVLAICVAAALYPLALGVTFRQPKKPTAAFVIRFIVCVAVFFAVTLTLNNGLRIGEDNAISVTLLVAAVWALVCTVRYLIQTKKENE